MGSGGYSINNGHVFFLGTQKGVRIFRGKILNENAKSFCGF
jgi:hypothetical protein